MQTARPWQGRPACQRGDTERVVDQDGLLDENLHFSRLYAENKRRYAEIKDVAVTKAACHRNGWLSPEMKTDLFDCWRRFRDRPTKVDSGIDLP
jgi:hypothetical protein